MKILPLQLKDAFGGGRGDCWRTQGQFTSKRDGCVFYD